jgi:ABC-type sugar transport system permease subunit
MGNPELMSFLKNPETNFWTLLIYSQWLGFAGGLVIYTGAMSRIPVSVVEYGKLDGLGYVREFISITIPLIFPTLSVTLITIATGLFMSSLPLYQFYGPSAQEHLYSISYYMYIMVVGQTDNPVKFPFSAAMSLVISCVTVPITLLMRHLVEKYGPSVEY